MFRSQLFDHLQGVVFLAQCCYYILCLFASSSCLFGMWLYVVYVCVCVPDVLVCGMFGCGYYFSACLHRQVVYLVCGCMLSTCVCACLMYLFVGCLVVNETSHRQVHQARTHIDNITATYQINNLTRQTSREGSNHNQTSHRQVHQAHTHTHRQHTVVYQINNLTTQTSREIVTALSTKDDPLKMVKQL